ncbi:MAG: GHKL domain-containing protein [Lachnospiraceae bacterium]|nr:GHKL domain-containing protein [Lachnospiraceae bacterium]
MQSVYELFRHLHFEWALYAGILSLGLRRFFAEEAQGSRKILFVPGCVITCALTMPLVNLLPFRPVFSSQGSAIWALYLIFFMDMLIWTAVCCPGHVRTGAAYTTYYLLFIILFKGALAPFYAAETALDHVFYALVDMATILVLCGMLFLMTLLFGRFQLMIRHSDAPNYYNLAVLIPFLIIIVFSLIVSGNSFFTENTQPVLSGCLALLLPLIYYNYAQGSRAFAESRELETALLRTQADLNHYRGAIELDERIRRERHELKNRYLHIQVLLKENRLEELEAYLSEEIGARMEALSEAYTGNTLIDYILHLKQQEAEKASIPFKVSVLLRKTPRVPDDLFCTILLNLLDNALEASGREEKPGIQVTFSNRGAYLVLQVKNRVSRNVLLFNPGLLTTKKDRERHGHGLSIVRSAVREAGGMMEIRTDEGFFDVTAALPDFTERSSGKEDIRHAP